MFRDLEISACNIDIIKDMVPEPYLDLIVEEKLFAIAVYDGSGDENLVGVSVEGSHMGWLKLIWMRMAENYRDDIIIADFIRYRMRMARRTGLYEGAFFELSAAELGPQYADILQMADMEVMTSLSNCMAFSISEIRNSDRLIKASRSLEFTPLADAEYEVLIEAGWMLMEASETKNIPSSLDWDAYDGVLSFICRKDDDVCGLFMVSRAADYLVTDFMYVTGSSVTPGVIGHAIEIANKLFPPTQMILVPAAMPRSRRLVEELVPTVKRDEIIEGVCRFSLPPIPPLKAKLQELMRNKNLW